MVVLALGMWSWIGIALLAWCVFSFSFALWLGRVIRASEELAQQPLARRRPEYDSGARLQSSLTEVRRMPRDRDEDATGSHG